MKYEQYGKDKQYVEDMILEAVKEILASSSPNKSEVKWNLNCLLEILFHGKLMYNEGNILK